MKTGRPREQLLRRSVRALAFPLRLLPIALQLPPGELAISILSKPVLKYDPERLLTNRTVVMCVEDLALKIPFLFKERGIKPIPSIAQADVTIRGNLRDYLSLLFGREDPDTLFFQRRLVMEGDTELGLILKNSLLSAISIKGQIDFFGPIRSILESSDLLNLIPENLLATNHKPIRSREYIHVNSEQKPQVRRT